MFRRLWLPGLAAAAIAAYFFWFAGAGLRADFTHDDLMNIHRSWRPPAAEHLRDILLFFRFSHSYRPVGSLFYQALFDQFGFNPLPYRVACYLLLLANLWLSYFLLRRLANSREAAAVAVLLYAYHWRFWPLYFNTGTCYDLLCLFFYALALLYYLRARERGVPLGWSQVAIWSCLYVLCLNSKEMAVTLPAMIAVHELLRGRPRCWRVPLVGGALTALFIAGRLAHPDGLAGMEAYRPVFHKEVYADRAYHFLSWALYEPAWLTPAAAAALLALLLLAAALSRSAAFRFGLAWVLIGILPLAFIQQRGLDAASIPALGFVLCLSLAINVTAARVWEGLRRHYVWSAERFPARGVSERLRPIVVFVVVLLGLAAAHSRYGRIEFSRMAAEGRYIRFVYEELRARPIPSRSRVLFLDDPFPRMEWGTTFLVQLCSRDRSIQVDRLDRVIERFDRAVVLDYDVVFTWDEGRLRECDAAPFRGITAGALPARARLAARACALR